MRGREEVGLSVSLIQLTGTETYDLPADSADVEVPIEIPDGYSKIAVIEVAGGSSRGVIANFATTSNGLRMHVANATGSPHSGRTAKATIVCAKLL